jgi:hypothetical protein
MTTYADLEIGLHRRDITYYAVDLRFIHPQSDSDIRLVRGSDLPLARFDHEKLRALLLDPHAYGAALTAHLFADQEVPTAFEKAFTMAQSLDMPLRVRLFIGPSAPDLHALRWETLHLPGSSESLLTSEHILFSRYLGSTDWRPIRLRPKSDLRALVVVANPQNVGEYAPGGSQLAPVDVEGEVARAQSALGDMKMTVLTSHPSNPAPEPPTLAAIASHLRDGYDILYLVAHGAMLDGDPYLWLEDEQGNAAVTAGRDLERQMRELRQRPRLVVLASCQSGGSSHDGGALTALGPRLAEIGVPAVLAMQDNISMQTTAAFMPAFFRELLRDGQIDRAMAVARGVVRDRPDWWVPVLFLRLKSGCIWYQPGFGEERKGFERWPALIKNIQRSQCTPILGTHLSELLGTQVEIAHRWAEKHNFPLEPYRSEYLSQVAQYLAVTQQPIFPRDDLLDQVRQELLTRYDETLPTEARQGTLEDLLTAVGSARRADNEADPYKVLAELPFSVYITANFTNLLSEALTAAGKQPIIEICRWNDYIETLPSIYDEEPDYLPDVQRPLVYHLFGHISEPDSLVVTEDDYFDYLIGFSSNDDLVPAPVNEVLADNGLLFLGFQPDDWDFRILFRSLAKLWVRRRRRRYINISAQIAPDETRIQEPVRARRYLEAYFQEAHIDIYWGTVEDFARDMLAQWRTASTQTRRR